MARWIDASPAQRFWQYTYPAARRTIESGQWDACIADYDAQIGRARDDLAGAVPDSFDARARARRLAALERDRDSCRTQRERDEEIVAEAGRRRAARTA